MTRTVVSRTRDLEVAAEAAELLLHGVNLASDCQKVVNLPLERREASALACATDVTPDVAGTSFRRPRWHCHRHSQGSSWRV